MNKIKETLKEKQKKIFIKSILYILSKNKNNKNKNKKKSINNANLN